jgi:riboflavin synthase
MFTGLVEEIGRLEAIEPRGEGRRLVFGAACVLEDAHEGDSIAVDGCCLTVVALEPGRFAVEAVPETLRRTTLGGRRAGDPVNLERPLRAGDRLGGHLVQGHVDGVGEVVAMIPEGDGRRLTLRIPPPLARFVAEKGSIAVDGVSLTVAACEGERCEIALIPHTLAATVAGAYAAGRRVNLEVDLVARYVARLLEDSSAQRRNA